MSIINPPFLGLVFLKSERAERAISDYRDKYMKNPHKIFGDEFNEDELLIGFSLAMSARDLNQQVEYAESLGAIYGQDFVATSSAKGILGDVPAWLRQAADADTIVLSYVHASPAA